MKKFLCSGFRSVISTDIKAAAEIFANRQARRDFGRGGYCRVINANSYTEDYRHVTFNAFVGYRSGPFETTGHNIVLTVHAD